MTDTLDEITVTAPAVTGTSTSVQQFGRKVSLIVSDAQGNGIDLSQFRIRFATKRGDYQNPNIAEIRVYNLSSQTANKIAGKEFSQLALQAGYEGNYGIIFSGTISQARIGRENQMDSYVDFTAADGDEAYGFSVLNVSLAVGANNGDQTVSAFLQSMKKAVPTMALAPSSYNLPANGPIRGRVFYGCTKDELRTFADTYDMSWSIQDGQLTLIPQSAYIEGDIVTISADTGMIGIPEQTQNGISVRVLLNPNIKIGRLIQIQGSINQYEFALDTQSQSTNQATASTNKINAEGKFYVMVANHTGDTRGNEWYTDLTCLAIDASLPVTSDIYLRNFTALSSPVPRY